MKNALRTLMIGITLAVGSYVTLAAQEYTGITGMMHVPTAEMAPAGTARIGGFF